MKREEITETLRLHRMWMRGEEGGQRANLRGADLRGADLSGADLRGANLRWAGLLGAKTSDPAALLAALGVEVEDGGES